MQWEIVVRAEGSVWCWFLTWSHVAFYRSKWTDEVDRVAQIQADPPEGLGGLGWAQTRGHALKTVSETVIILEPETATHLGFISHPT